MEIITKIVKERERQDQQWGGAKHDDQHSVYDFVHYMEKFKDRIRRPSMPVDELLDQHEDSYLKIAALAIAGLEWIERRKQVKGG